ncbi:TPA: hypothetical protein N0F65_008008 [Lagenidium giganteum]|uniref:Methyltransferase domain-containing protein n=1 Tax=Lagenidium giganteum TaxID=4803 RepID=A0AAV2YSP1_9STRA|nr:TPA: hypothetical protein N0F65_008008 [Lagenidium giganteum]
MRQQLMEAAQTWHPHKYLTFESHRLRPALELLGRIPAPASVKSPNDDVHVVDLGAGTCNMGPAFLQRWPNARVTFVDSSDSMLARGKEEHSANPELDASRFSYVQDSFETFTPTAPVDVIYSNAALHWVSAERHAKLLPRLLSFLKPGGVLAFQIPDSRLQPSHQLMVEAGKRLNLQDRLANVRWVTCERDPSYYYQICHDLEPPQVSNLDMWSTAYAQILSGENPVADFTSSTGLGPYLEELGGRESPAAQQFEAKYRELILEAYPKEKDGRTIFNMKRFFFVATKLTDAQ